MNIEQIKQIAKESGASRLFSKDDEEFMLSGNKQIEAFANAIIKAYVAEQKPTIWLTQKEFDTLKRAQKTDRETVPLYDLKGE